MFLGILVSMIIIGGIISYFGGVLKKAMEVVSFILKLGIGGSITMLISYWLSIDFNSTWGQIGFLFVGAIIFTALIAILAGTFRLVGFSINYLLNSFLILLLASILKDKISIGFALYAVILFVFPRLMWVSDRLSTSEEYSHSEYKWLEDAQVTYYTIKDIDWWEDLGDSWRNIPLQIVIASIFYATGSITIVSTCPIQSTWMTLVYVIIAVVVNVMFDLFAFRKIDEALV